MKQFNLILVVCLGGAWCSIADEVVAQCSSVLSVPDELAVRCGPGTEMTRIINRLGLGSDCERCRSLAAQMDQGGPYWVQQNYDYVVAQTIRNAERLGHRMGPVRRAGVRSIVRRSIRLSR